MFEERNVVRGEKGGVGCLRTGMLRQRRGGEPRGGVFHRNALGGLGSFSLWMWWETIVEGVKDSTATGKSLQWDNMKSSTAVGSNPWER